MLTIVLLHTDAKALLLRIYILILVALFLGNFLLLMKLSVALNTYSYFALIPFFMYLNKMWSYFITDYSIFI